MKGPCAEGYHVPTALEWASAIANITGFAAGSVVTDQAKRDLFVSTLKIPSAGRRGGGIYSFQGTYGYYWAS